LLKETEVVHIGEEWVEYEDNVPQERLSKYILNYRPRRIHVDKLS